MAGLDFVLRLRNASFRAGMDESTARVKKFRQDFSKYGKVAIGAGVALGLRRGFQDALAFGRGMREAFTLIPGASREMRDSLTRDVRALGLELKVLPEQVIPALYQALSAGVPPGNVIDFLRQAGQAALGGVTDMATAVDGISSAVNAYGADVLSAQRASDLMFTAVRLGKTTFGELAGSMSSVTPFASALGIGFEEVTAAVSALTAKGTPTAQAMTQIRALLVDLSREGSRSAEMIEKIAGVSFPEFVRQGGTLYEALQMIQAGASASDRELMSMFARVEAGSAALGLLSDSKFVDDLQAMATAAGATQAAFEEMGQGVDRELEGMQTKARDAAMAFGAFGLRLVSGFTEAIGSTAGKAVDAIAGVKDAGGASGFSHIAEQQLDREGAFDSLPRRGRRKAREAMIEERAWQLFEEDTLKREQKRVADVLAAAEEDRSKKADGLLGDPDKLRELLGETDEGAEDRSRKNALEQARRRERQIEERVFMQGLSEEDRAAYLEKKRSRLLSDSEAALERGDELGAVQLRTEAREIELDLMRLVGMLTGAETGGAAAVTSLQRVGLASNTAMALPQNPEAERQTKLLQESRDFLSRIASRDDEGGGDGEFGGGWPGEIA